MDRAPRASFQPAGAGMLLASTTVLAIGLGALVGWGAGDTGLGLLGGAIAGIPLGVFVVYRRYRGAF